MQNIKKSKKIIVCLLLCVFLSLTLFGCKTKDNQQPLSEIDAFMTSIRLIKTNADKDDLTLEIIDDAKVQAMVLSSLIDEDKYLLEDQNYKETMIEIDDILESIDITQTKADDTIKSDFNQLVTLVNYISDKYR